MRRPFHEMEIVERMIPAREFVRSLSPFCRPKAPALPS